LNGFPIPKFAIGKPSVCLNGSAKIPKFVLGSLRDKLQLGGAIDYLSLTIAAWCHYLNGYDRKLGYKPRPFRTALYLALAA
jgi:mannitol 2-dehydrogenase